MCAFHTNIVLYSTVVVLITVIKVISAHMVPYNTALVWHAQFIKPLKRWPLTGACLNCKKCGVIFDTAEC